MIARSLRLSCLPLLCGLALVGTASAATQVLVIAGLGGEAQFDERFTKWSEQVAKASATATGDAARVQRLAGESARREDIQAALRAAAEKLREGDQFMLVLLGHGSFDGSEYRFNIAGPDITGSEMLALLDRMPAGVLQLVVNATSTSGAIAERWVKPNRVVITATRTGGERNAPRFGAFWAEALASDEADRDKDGAVTALEAFDFATRKVNDAYKSDAAVVTEHAKVTGSEPTRFVVARLGAAAMFANDAQLIALRTEQAGIERRLAQLQLQRKELQQDEYFNRIEPVLVELARLGVRVDTRLATLGVRAGESSDAKP
ncbi:MAG: hypothetical protein ABIP38_14010 [Steroidobacteraceae bacterium]